jgi:uncharacterized protein YdeI (YjbR/CyaY-like superfamily)
MEMRKTLHVTDREAWRSWLTTHYASETEVWLVFYKKHSGKPRIPYDDAVEEALCFGWIDSIVKSIDDEKFAQKFTPRRDVSKWSALNKRRLVKVIREGRMTAAGLAKVDAAVLSEKRAAKLGTEDVEIPRAVKQALMVSPKAWKVFQSLTPSRRKAYIRLIMDAKKEETRERQVQKAISLLEQNTGSLDDVPPFVKRGLKVNAKAWENFQNLAPSYRRNYVGWIMHAKQEETRERRLQEAIVLLKQNRKLGLK